MKARDAKIFALGPLGAALIGLVSVPLLAWTFSPAQMGRFNLLQTCVSFIALFFCLGLEQSFSREFHESTSVPALARVSLIPPLVLFLIVALGTALLFAEEAAHALYGVPDERLAYLTIVAGGLALMARIFGVWIRMSEKAATFALGQVVPKIVLAAMVLCLALGFGKANFVSLSAILVLSTASGAVIFGVMCRSLVRKAFLTRAPSRVFASMVTYGLPLVGSGVAYWAMTASGPAALRLTSQFHELGLFAVATSFAGVAILFQAVFSVLWAPIVFRWVAQGATSAQIENICEQALLAVSVMICGVGSASWLLTYVIPLEYRGVENLVVVTMFPALLYVLSEITGVGISVARRTMLLLVAALVGLSIAGLFHWGLVPRFGAHGAGAALVFGYLGFLICRTEFAVRAWGPLRRGRLYVQVLGLGLLAVAHAIVPGVARGYWALGWTLALVMVCVSSRRTLRELISQVRERAVEAA